ncbi:hypothetical protein A2U01_0110971, partial [Trifolium medium]|nr:hypothetical protein [Trifolium medium]
MELTQHRFCCHVL